MDGALGRGAGAREPLLQQWLEFAHVLERQVERLETRYRRLRKVVAVQFAHGQADVALREACRPIKSVRQLSDSVEATSQQVEAD